MTSSAHSQVPVKICGLVRREDAELAASLGVWALGFVFAPGTPRAVLPSVVVDVANALGPHRPRIVGVFLNPSAPEIQRALEEAPLDLVQIHGQPPAQIAEVVPPIRLVTAVSLSIPSDLQVALSQAALSETSGWLLADRPRDLQGRPSGRVNWALVAELSAARPGRVLLAGGLDETNVRRAILTSRPAAVDVASGVEGSHPREKSADKLKSFVAAAQLAFQEVVV